MHTCVRLCMVVYVLCTACTHVIRLGICSLGCPCGAVEFATQILVNCLYITVYRTFSNIHRLKLSRISQIMIFHIFKVVISAGSL